MKFGAFYEHQVPRPWHDGDERRVFDEALEQAELLDRIGFHSFWLVEHHFREGRSHMPCNDVVLGALSQATKNIRLGFGVSLMPHEYIHPARIAEKVATVDLLSGGRAEWGMGRSTPMEQQAFGVDVPMTLFLTPSPVAFWIGPTFGPGVEAQLTRELLVGLNTRFGPVIRSGIPGVNSFFDSSGAEFGFVVQMLLAYRI